MNKLWRTGESLSLSVEEQNGRAWWESVGEFLKSPQNGQLTLQYCSYVISPELNRELRECITATHSSVIPNYQRAKTTCCLPKYGEDAHDGLFGSLERE